MPHFRRKGNGVSDRLTRRMEGLRRTIPSALDILARIRILVTDSQEGG